MCTSNVFRFVVVVLSATLTGCPHVDSTDSGETGVLLRPELLTNVALGSSIDLAVIDTCSDAETKVRGTGGKIPSDIHIDFQRQTCDLSTIEGIDARSSDDTVISIDSTESLGRYGIVRLDALSEGTVTIDLDITASTGPHDLRGEYRVLAVNRVELTAICGEHRSEELEDAVVYGMAGNDLVLTPGLFHDDLPLVGYGYSPFEFGDLELSNVDPNRVTIPLPAEGGTFSIRSPLDEDFERVVEVLEPADIDSLGLAADEATCETLLRWAPRVGDEQIAICSGTLEVALTSETPDVCGFTLGDGNEVTVTPYFTKLPNGNAQRLYSVGPGICRISGRVVGEETIDSIEFEFPRCVEWDQTLPHRVAAMAPLTTGETCVFSLSDGAFLHDGSSVTEVTELSALGPSIRDAWETSPQSVVVLSDKSLFTWDGSGLDEVDLGQTFNRGAAFDGETLLIGGSILARYGARGLESERIDGTTFSGIWADDNMAVASGYAGTPGAYESKVAMYDGETWLVEVLNAAARLHDVWGTGPDDLYVVGDDCLIMHYDGSEWSAVDLECEEDLKAVHGSSNGRVVAVGDRGIVAQFDGTGWTVEWLRGFDSLTAVSVRDGQLLVGGTGGLRVGP